MKTNLDTLFKNDEVLETDGIWMEISDKTAFLVKRFGGMNDVNIKAAMAKHYKPYARLVENGTIDPKKEKEIMTTVFAKACLKGWRGVEIDGVDTPFSLEVAVKFLLALPELAGTLMAYAQDTKNYREDLGNS